MLIRIPNEVIEIAKSEKDIDKMLEILWDAVRFKLTWEIVDKWLLDLLDPNLRRSQKMKWNKNSVKQTEKQSVTDCKKQTVTHCKNRVLHTEKTECNRLKITDENWLNQENRDKYNIIYNNIQLYDIVYKYITDNNITYTLNYLIKKKWEKNFINSQVEEAEKLIKKVWFDTFKTILNYIPNDEFRSKNILSIAKLNKSNRDWVPYYIVIMDRIKSYTPKVVSIPTV